MKGFLIGIFAFVLLSSVATAFGAQDLSIGTPATQTVKILISENGDAHVIHIVDPSSNSQQVIAIRNDFTNLKVMKETGISSEYGQTSGEKHGFLIFPSKQKVLVEYDLKNAATLQDGMWYWDYQYTDDTKLYPPEKADLIFVNGNPIILGEKKGINCHGCQVKLEYELGSTETIKPVQWEGKKFDVKIITLGDISSFKFDQPNKKISFNVNEENKYITLVIPRDLLWNPYTVLLNDTKILKHEFRSDGENVWLSIKPDKKGPVEIIGVSAVPEFPLVSILILGSAMIFVARYKNKFSLH